MDTQVKNSKENIGGIGSSVNKGIDAATSVITGILTGNIAGGLAGATAPYLAEQIKLHTGHQESDGSWQMDDPKANLVAHAILSAVIAQLQGNSALAGAAGAPSGETIAGLIIEALYGNKNPKDLSESEKQNISNLTQLALGLATALATGGDMGDTGTAVNAGKNAVENNYLSATEDKEKKDAQKQLELIEKGLRPATEEEKQQLKDEIAAKESIDKYRDEVLKAACQNLSSSDCTKETEKLDAAYDSYFKQIKPQDYEEYNDAYATYTKYYDGYKDIDALKFDLNVQQVAADREILAQRISENWGVDKATADKIVLGMRISNDLFGVAAAVYGPKVVDEMGITTAPKNSSVAKPNAGGNIAGENISAGKGTTTVKTPDGISFNIDQPAHLSAVEKYTQQKGITGGHNADAFYSAANQNGVKVVSETPTGIPGVTEVKYQIPAKDRAGNIIGYKDKPLTKTIYDPKIVSDQKILDLGQQAAASGYKSAITSGAREYTSSAGGISFRVYLDPKTGTVTNFFPVTK